MQATSLYDENKNLIGSNTVIFDLTKMSNDEINEYKEFVKDANKKLDEIKEKDYDNLDKNSKSEYDGLKTMFEMLSKIDFEVLKKNN